MADKNTKWSENVPGRFYVDQTCIDCGACWQLAPANFARKDADGHAYVFRQPGTKEEELQSEEAMNACPVGAIGKDGDE